VRHGRPGKGASSSVTLCVCYAFVSPQSSTTYKSKPAFAEASGAKLTSRVTSVNSWNALPDLSWGRWRFALAKRQASLFGL